MISPSRCKSRGLEVGNFSFGHKLIKLCRSPFPPTNNREPSLSAFRRQPLIDCCRDKGRENGGHDQRTLLCSQGPPVAASVGRVCPGPFHSFNCQRQNLEQELHSSRILRFGKRVPRTAVLRGPQPCRPCRRSATRVAVHTNCHGCAQAAFAATSPSHARSQLFGCVSAACGQTVLVTRVRAR